jgi:hypothetical protein
MSLDKFLLPDISIIVYNYLGRYRKDYNLDYLLKKDLCVLIVDKLDTYDFKECKVKTANLCIKHNQIYLLELLEKKRNKM